MQQLLLILSQTDQPSLGIVRCLPSLQATLHEGRIYLKVPETLATDKRILQLPVLHSYWLDSSNHLFPLNGLTPTGKLPQLNWMAITDFIPVEMPVAAMPAQLPVKVAITVVPSTHPQESFALLTNLQTWKAWAEYAPAIRLANLQFALSANNDVLITGHPLPALPGKEYWMQHHVFMPAGYSFETAVTPDIISNELNPENNSYLLFDAAGNWQQIPLDCFVPASRSAVRLTEFVK